MKRLRVGLAVVLGLVGATAAPASTAFASQLHCTYGATAEFQTRICLERLSTDQVRGVVWITNTSRAAALDNAIRVEVLGRGAATYCPWAALPPGGTRSCATPVYQPAPAPQQASVQIFYHWASGASGSIVAQSPKG